MKETTVSDYLDNDYADYGMYTIEHRAIPSVIDGLKPTQRKIIHISNKVWKNGNEKPIKIFQLGGRIASEAAYHHGDTSLNATIIGMAQKFKNSMPLLDEIGQFGSMRSPEPGAARYISTKTTSNFRLLYKDFALVDKQYEEGYEIEPKFFLPIIPTVLLNGSSGIAVGFSTNILNRNPVDLINCCLNELSNKKFNEPLPWWRHFNGVVESCPINNNKFIVKGLYDIRTKQSVNIKELPPGMTYQKYENHLNKLCDIGAIQLYDDNCADSINYTIQFSRIELKNRIEKNQVEGLLKLNESYSENLTCLNEHGKLIIFKTPTELIKYFVKFRLSYYYKRKEYLLNMMADRLNYLSNKSRFIKDIIDDKLKINNVPKKQIILYLETENYDEVDGSYNYLLNMPIHSLTKERYETLVSEINTIKKEIETLSKRNPITMYKSDLKDLLKKLV